MLSPDSMSSTPLQELPAQGVSSGSVHTLASRPFQTTSDPPASKRVCFYKSGDYKFSGHRMVINARTFKTFDALLDTLSKKVPLSFGVRAITTPRGTHPIKGLEDLHDGGSYVCSDQKRVKPLNLDAVYQRQVPWNTTRPVSAGRLRRNGPLLSQFGRRNEAISRPTKITDRVAVRTPKRLVVIKNRDATIKRRIVLQRRTAPTFNALLDYLSQIMQFRVLKLYSADGRRVDGLAALILCSGVIVAAGNEPFRLGNYNFHRSGQMAQPFYSDTGEPTRLQPLAHKNKSLSSGRGSRNFSLSSERYIVNQIHKSLSGRADSHLCHHDNGSFETEVNVSHTSTDMETCKNARPEDGHQHCKLPRDEDIEKSFRINQDGSMTIEMKVRLAIKEEELLHWTTTLSRSSLNQGTVCVSKSGSGSPDSNNAVAKDSSSISEDESKEVNRTVITEKSVGFSDERAYDCCHHMVSEIPKSSFKRIPTPGPHVRNNASTESIKTTTQSCMEENTLGHYSYMERTVDGESTKGFYAVRHTTSSSNRPIPKPRKTASAGTNSKGNHSSVNPSGVADVLQINNNGMENTKTVMHIYERQGCFDNYLANHEYGTDGISGHGSTGMSRSKPTSSDTQPHSSSNDCDIDFTQKTSSTNSLCRWKEEILSLSSEPLSPTPGLNNLTSFTDNEAQTIVNTREQSPPKETESVKRVNTLQGQMKKKGKLTVKKSSPSTSSSDKKQKGSMTSTAVSSKHLSSDNLSKTTNTNSSKKTRHSSESGENGQKGKVTETLHSKKEVNRNETTPNKKPSLQLNINNVKGASPKKRTNINQRAPRDNGHIKNALEKETARPPMKKKMLEISQPKKPSLSGKDGITRQKSMTENRISSPTQEISESVSMPALNPTPSDVHQYVENWLQKISPDSIPYIKDTATQEPELQTKVVFKIGGDSDSDTKSEFQNNTEDYYPSHGDAITKSVSCLSVPVSQEGPCTDMVNTQRTIGLSVSMPNFRVDSLDQERKLKMHKSTEAIVPVEGQSLDLTSNLISPKAKIKPILRQLCSSIQCIRNVCNEPSISSNLEKANSLPDFSSQVVSVFGSSSKALLSFLSVMTLKESLTGSVAGDSYGSKDTSEALLVVESLQKISTIEDEEQQRASLTDLQNRTSCQLREHWRDFQVLRERLESEPMSPKFSEQEFALDVVSEGGDPFDHQHFVINELMEELNMPQDLREQISSTLPHTKSFYPEVEESIYSQMERPLSDGEEELEQFNKEECDCKIIQSPQPDCVEEATAEDFSKEDNENGSLPAGDITVVSNSQSLCHEQTNILSSPDQKIYVKDSEPGESETEEKEDTSKGYACRSGKSVAVDREKQRDGRADGEELTEVCEGTKEVKEGKEGKAVAEEKDGVTEIAEQTTEEFKEGLDEDREGEQEAMLQGEDEDEKEPESDDREEVEDNGEEDLGDEVDEKNERKVEIVEENSENSEEGKGDEGQVMIIEEKDEKDDAQQLFVEDEEKRESEGNTEPEEGEVELEAKDEMIEEQINGEEEETGAGDTEEGPEEETDEEKDKNLNQEEAIAEEEEELEDRADEVYHANEDKVAEDEDGEEDEGNVEAQQGVMEEEPSEDDSDEDNPADGLDEGCQQTEDESERSSSEPVIANTDRFARTGVGAITGTENEEDSLRQCFMKSQCGDEKGQGTDIENEYKTDDGGEEEEKDLTRNNPAHPVEISSELLDFVNSALQSSSLIFIYDAQGNIRIEPDMARVIQTKQIMIPKNRKDSPYGLKQLPSPCTSDLSDYRPDTSESGGYNTQESLDIVTESGEELSERRSPEFRHARIYSVESSDLRMSCQSNSELLQCPSLRSGETHSGTKSSKEDLSYVSAASSSKADIEAGTVAATCNSVHSEVDLNDGVLIDQGRWLIKENHLIRKSPPVLAGMYSNVDTSVDTSQDNTSVESSPHYLTQQNPLAAISSSELEDMAKPQSPKCAYYNMPHGSDSEPFLDDVSVKSRKKYTSSGKENSVKVSPTIDTSKTWAKKNGSLSSFASVEFKMADSRVHPEGETSSVIQARRPSNGTGNVTQAQDSLDSFHLRCGQYCPIL